MGNSVSNTITVGDHFTVQTNLPGSQLFSSPGNDVFQAVQDLITSLQSGDQHRLCGQRSQQCLPATSIAQRVFLRQCHEPAQLPADLPEQRDDPAGRSSKTASAVPTSAK